MAALCVCSTPFVALRWVYSSGRSRVSGACNVTCPRHSLCCGVTLTEESSRPLSARAPLKSVRDEPKRRSLPKAASAGSLAPRLYVRCTLTPPAERLACWLVLFCVSIVHSRMVCADPCCAWLVFTMVQRRNGRSVASGCSASAAHRARSSGAAVVSDAAASGHARRVRSHASAYRFGAPRHVLSRPTPFSFPCHTHAHTYPPPSPRPHQTPTQ